MGSHVIRIYSKTQSLVALSSAESEFYGTLKAATESLGVLALMEDMGLKGKVMMKVDASAALGVIQRRGIGKTRHLQTGALWIQEQNLRNVITFHKTPGALNLADLFTENVPRQVCEKHMEGLGCTFESGRAGVAAQLHSIKNRIEKAHMAFTESIEVNDISVAKVFDWTGAAELNVDYLIEFVESQKNSEVSQAMGNWKTQVVDEVNSADSGMICHRCAHCDDPKSWKDHWATEKGDTPIGDMSIRHHSKPRHSRFTPSRTVGGPKDCNALVATRVTIG